MPEASVRWDERLARRGGTLELLRLPAAVYGAAVGLRGAAYDKGWMPVASLGVPVISVGNLTSGGTGKTPLVAWLARAIERRGLRPGVLARGYGARDIGALNDEGQELARELPGLYQEQDPDRVRGGRRLVARGAEVVVLDDGFQHRRLARDVDLCLIDATRPWGLPAERGARPVCALLPRGLLREPRAALARADALVLTRAESAAEAELALLERELERLAPGRPVLRARHRPRGLRAPDGSGREARELAGRAVDLVSGIGNPAAFEAAVVALGARVAVHRAFADHHAYRREDLAGLGGERWLVTTAKDAVKLAALGVAHLALEVELELVRGLPVLEALLDTALLPCAAAPGAGAPGASDA